MECTGDTMQTKLSGKSEVYAVLSRALQYPQIVTAEACADAALLVQRLYPAVGDVFAQFVREFRELPIEAREELYVGTFDVNPVCCLDVGYAVFGEDYKRGQFMAELIVRYRECGVDPGSDLPDFLPNILRLMTRLDYAEAQALVSDIVIKGIEKMVTGFSGPHPYKNLIEVVQGVLRLDYLVN